MEQHSQGDIQSLSAQQQRLEHQAREIQIERDKREKEENTRHNVAIGEIQRWYHGEIKLLNDRIKQLNEDAKGLMPVRPRR
jgi:hypothetical protein